MQYILTEQELNRGCELILSWTEKDIPLEEVYDKSGNLNEQGWFTVINCTDFDKNLFEIMVFGKNK